MGYALVTLNLRVFSTVSATWLPMYPAPPGINTRFFSDAIVEGKAERKHPDPKRAGPRDAPYAERDAGAPRRASQTSHLLAMPSVRVPASFYRGGTSRGLLFRAADLAPYAPVTRDAIVCAAMGSPDPDGRQIDGLGGGASSLSKVALVSAPGKGLYTQILRELGDEWKLPGVAWADDAAKAHHPTTGWDVVYRFGQVPINGNVVDWESTCGNMLSAVGLFALHNRIVHPETYAADQGLQNAAGFGLPVRILMAATGKRATVTLPVQRLHKRGEVVYEFSDVADTSIAGVPGLSPRIEVSTPLESSTLPTGNMRDVLDVDGQSIPVTIVDAGLPTVLVRAADLGVDTAQVVQSAAALDQDTALHGRIEALRQRAAQCTPGLQAALCSSAPKVVLVHPRTQYTTSSGHVVPETDMDVLVRPVSVGQFHRSIMATALSAMAVAHAYPGSVVREAAAQGGAPVPPKGDQCTITVGQPAGTSSATVQLSDDTPISILYTRTARRIIDGLVDVPKHVAERWAIPYAEIFEARKQKKRKPA